MGDISWTVLQRWEYVVRTKIYLTHRGQTDGTCPSHNTLGVESSTFNIIHKQKIQISLTRYISFSTFIGLRLLRMAALSVKFGLTNLQFFSGLLWKSINATCNAMPPTYRCRGQILLHFITRDKRARIIENSDPSITEQLVRWLKILRLVSLLRNLGCHRWVQLN